MVAHYQTLITRVVTIWHEPVAIYELPKRSFTHFSLVLGNLTAQKRALKSHVLLIHWCNILGGSTGTALWRDSQDNLYLSTTDLQSGPEIKDGN